MTTAAVYPVAPRPQPDAASPSPRPLRRMTGVERDGEHAHAAAQDAPERLRQALYYGTPRVALYQGDAAHILAAMDTASVDCIVTSPPYYGQRDYAVAGQLGLEAHPQEYIDKLVAVFREARRVLKPGGSLWVNIGDTYWSGKGRPHGKDAKQKARRFTRPQDRAGKRPLCRPKQLLLIPHRFAIAMQEDRWIVRNDNVWRKTRSTPDPAKDRSAAAHEYMFHFVKRGKYHYDYDAVAVPSTGKTKRQAPPSVWDIPAVPSRKNQTAVFPDRLVILPIRATCPPDGVVLDPFCGSGTTLLVALAEGAGRRAIGIDVSPASLGEARGILQAAQDRLPTHPIRVVDGPIDGPIDGVPSRDGERPNRQA